MAAVLDRSFRRALCASLLTAVALALVPAVAQAGVGFSIVPTVPANVTAGQTGVASTVVITNASANGPGEAGFDVDSMRIDTITIVPSCGSAVVGADCTAGSFDPGVIVPSPLTGSGRAGTACASKTFTFAVIDPAQGKYAVTTSPLLTLGPSSGTLAVRQCVIDYTASVVKQPTIDSTPATPGLQTSQKAGVTGTDIGPTVSNINFTGGGVGTASTTVAAGPGKAAPTIATTASPAILLGGQVTDTATVTGRVNPLAGATIEFRLYGPTDTSCAGTPVFTSVVAHPVSEGPVTSTAFTPTAVGIYRWRAFYSGDANNNAVSGACGDAGESVGVVPPPPPQPPPTQTCAGKKATIVAAAGKTTINGTPGADVIVGGAAAEKINGAGGNDLICAGAGNDTVRGGAGKDTLLGEDGKDKLFGEAGNDLLRGGAGDDGLSGGAGKDSLRGEDGKDTVSGGSGDDGLAGGRGRDVLNAGSGKDRVSASGGGADRIDCGPGRPDRVVMDRSDRQRRCESVRRA